MLRVSPGARTTEVEGPYGASALKIRVAARPLSGLCGVPRSRVELVRGATGGDETVLLCGVDLSDARSALAPVLV